MTLSKNQIVLIGLGLLIIVIFVGLFFIGGKKETPVSLTIWGTEPQENFYTAFKAYNKIHPKTNLTYKQIPSEDYEETLVNSLATEIGPDIAMFHRSWLMRQGNKLVPATNDQYSVKDLQNNFPDVVVKDFVYDNQVYALPLYIDTLGLYYNKDIFNNKGVLFPPKTWDDFKVQVANITDFNLSKQLQRSGAAMGGSIKTIFDAPDIITLLLMQFADQSYKNSSNSYYLQGAAQRGFEFYMQFSDPTSRYYTWSNSGEDALTNFSNGELGMMLDYSDKIRAIKEANPYLNFAVAPMPQYDNSSKVNYADYWGLGVMAQSANQTAAWQFVKEFTTTQEISLEYLKSSGHPPALKELVLNFKDDPMMSPFANQIITADSVFQYNISKFRIALSDAVESTLSGRFDLGRSLQEAAQKIKNLSR